MQQAEAETTLREAGFEPASSSPATPPKPKGTVIEQSPPAGETPPEGSTVTIVVSTFVEPTESPTPTETPDRRRPDAADRAPTDRAGARPLSRGQRIGSA